MSSDADAPPPSHLQVAAVVSFYMTSALVMIFVNKAVLMSSPMLPLLFLFFQMIIAVILLHVSTLFYSKVDLPTKEEITFANTKALAPVVLVNIIGLVFNTLCLRDVDASFFQIARGLVLPLTILISSLETRTRPSIPILLCATLVVAGFFIGVIPANIFSASPTELPVFSSSTPQSHSSRIVSLLYGFLSSLFIAIHAVLIKRSLKHVDGSTIKLAWWTNLGSALFLVPFLVFAGEPLLVFGMLRDGVNLSGDAGGVEPWRWDTFLWGSSVTGVFGFLLCMAGLLSVKVTSPITHMFSSGAKGVLQTLLGVWIFHDILTATRASSIFVILLGTILYTWVKSHELTIRQQSVKMTIMGTKEELRGSSSKEEQEAFIGQEREE